MSINKKDVAAILIFVALIAAFVLLVNNITNKNVGNKFVGKGRLCLLVEN